MNSVSFSFIVYSEVPLRQITEDAKFHQGTLAIATSLFRFEKKFNIDQLTRVCIYIVEHCGVNWSMQLTLFSRLKFGRCNYHCHVILFYWIVQTKRIICVIWSCKIYVRNKIKYN